MTFSELVLQTFPVDIRDIFKLEILKPVSRLTETVLYAIDCFHDIKIFKPSPVQATTDRLFQTLDTFYKYFIVKTSYCSAQC